MALTAHVFPQFQQKMGKKAVDLSADTLKVMLLSAFTYADSMVTIADVKAAGTECPATGGYSAGGIALVSPTIVTAAKVTTITTATNPSWAASTISAAYAVFYDAAGGTDSTNFPFAYWDFGGTDSSTAAAFTLTVSGSGIVTITAT